MDDHKYRCPITHDVMVDPVIATDGHTYERTAIERWLKTDGAKSPMTQEPFGTKRLLPNHFVKALIHEYVEGAAAEVKAAWQANRADVAASRKDLDAAQLFQAGRFAEAAELGHAASQVKLAQQYYAAGDEENCVKYATMLTDHGSSDGAFILGMMYFRDSASDEARRTAATVWFEECVAEFPNAYYMLAHLEADEEAKERLLLKGCRASDADCMFQLGEMSYAKKKYSVARRMFKRVAAQETSKKYDALFRLGGMCIQGLGGSDEYAKGQQYVNAAAEAGHPRALKLRRYNAEYDFS